VGVAFFLLNQSLTVSAVRVRARPSPCPPALVFRTSVFTDSRCFEILLHDVRRLRPSITAIFDLIDSRSRVNFARRAHGLFLIRFI
jgi:hypothetical protein